MIIIRLYLVIAFIFFYLYKLILANFYIAYDIVTPKMHIKPGFVWIPLKIKSNFGLLLFSNLVSMTPGTLSVDMKDDRKSILIHYLYQKNGDELFNELELLQDKILKLTR